MKFIRQDKETKKEKVVSEKVVLEELKEAYGDNAENIIKRMKEREIGFIKAPTEFALFKTKK
jgi:hypothetical protein